MRLIGSFQTMTTHTLAGLLTSSSEGRSTSTGAGATPTLLTGPIVAAGGTAGRRESTQQAARATTASHEDAGRTSTGPAIANGVMYFSTAAWSSASTIRTNRCAPSTTPWLWMLTPYCSAVGGARWVRSMGAIYGAP